MMTLEKYRLIIFDMDGTLADRDTAELLPGVAEWFEVYRDQFKFALATNQGGVGLRFWMESEGFGQPERYPTEAQVTEHIQRVLNALDVAMDVHVCFSYQSKSSGTWGPIPASAKDERGETVDQRWNAFWRKPADGMLLSAMLNARAKKSETLFVGDSDEDELAAVRAGVTFMHAYEFFQRVSNVD